MKPLPIALVDRDIELTKNLHQLLDIEGFPVETFSQTQEFLHFFNSNKAELIILDQNQTPGNGFQVLQSIRSISQAPVIFTVPSPNDSHRITAFELGSDDVVTKPYSMKEMVLRIKAILKRTNGRNNSKSQTQFHWAGETLGIDLLGHKVFIQNADVGLTGSEWEIFILLFSHKGHIFSRDQLSEFCLGYNPEGETRTIDTHIANLRTKLTLPGLIETIRGYGYRFSPDEEICN